MMRGAWKISLFITVNVIKEFDVLFQEVANYIFLDYIMLLTSVKYIGDGQG